MKEKKQEFKDWVFDDITWCADDKCQRTKCQRNQANRRCKEAGVLFSVSDFRGTEYCPKTYEVKK